MEYQQCIKCLSQNYLILQLLYSLCLMANAITQYFEIRFFMTSTAHLVGIYNFKRNSPQSSSKDNPASVWGF